MHVIVTSGRTISMAMVPRSSVLIMLLRSRLRAVCRSL